MYLFYNLCITLHVSNDYFAHQQEFIIYCIYSCVQTVQTCLDGLYTAADTVNYEFLLMNEIIVRNM